MRNTFSILNLCCLLFAAAFLLPSCEKEKNDQTKGSADTTPEDEPPYEFKDQVLQGQIGDTAWVFTGGMFGNSSDSGMFYAELWQLDQESENPCYVFSVQGNKVIFHVPQDTGLYELGYDLGQTITLYDARNNVNIAASQGAIEILDINREDSVHTVQGRIDARSGDSFVNGNFEVVICE